MLDVRILGSFFDSILEGIYVLDRDGNYIYANASYLKMCAGEKSDFIGLNVFQLVERGYVTESAGIKAFEEKRQVTMVNRVNNNKGYIFHQVITATPIFDGNGEIEYVVAEVMNLHTLNQHIQNAYQKNVNKVRISQIKGTDEEDEIIAVSDSMKNILSMANLIAEVDSTVLISGESGTGKDVIAHYIHEHSKRSGKTMLALNCAAMPESLLESELFGYVKGAYTGALNTGKAGLIQQANGGTLFIDEVNSIPLSVQSKLLRVLETRKVKRIGALEEESVDFRLIAATNQDLQKCIQEGTFRADLYYRLSVVPIEIPPLRERPADIFPLAWRFMDRYCRRYDRTRILTAEVLDQFLKYSWPGNVRELKNVIERLVVTSSADTFEIKRLPDGFLGGDFMDKKAIPREPMNWEMFYVHAPEQFSLKGYIEMCEAQIIEDVLERCGNVRAAAKFLKTDHSTIVRKRQRYQNP